MSASPLPQPFLVPENSNSKQQSPSRAMIVPFKSIRRRPNMQQGKALESLGHAIEYLVDSRMFLVGEPRTVGDNDAVRLLSYCSREVFSTCAEVVPVSYRLKMWAAERLHLGVLTPPGQARTRRV